jgi:GAF domain-containing protein
MTATPDHDTLTQLIERQAAASAALTQATTFSEIAADIAQKMLTEPGTFISINLADYDDRGELIRLRTAASANRTQSFEAESAVDVTEADIGDILRQTLHQPTPVIITDIETNTSLSEHFRAWLAGHKVKAFASMPMRHAGRTFGLISVNSITGELNLAQTDLLAYQTLADQVGALMQVHDLTEESARSTDISERQTNAFDELTAGQDFAQMAGIVARHMLPTPGRFVSLSKFTYDMMGNPSELKILATANRERTYHWDIETLDWNSLTQAFRDSVTEGRVYVIDDTDAVTPTDVGPGFYALFASNGIKSFLNIPMMMDGKPIAAMGIASRVKSTFTKAEINAFRTLCDQIAALIHARTLLEDSHTARDVANNLVLASRMISSAENYDDMAQAVIYTIARKMSAVALNLFDQPVPPGGTPQSAIISAIGTPDGALTFDGGRFINPAPDSQQIESLRRGLPIFNNDINAVGSPLSDDTQGQYIRLGVGWYAAFGLRAGDQLLGTLDVLHNQPVVFSPEEVDAYNTLADQIAITLENRNLLSQTEETLGFVQAQYEASSKINAARTAAEMLDAIYHFAGSGYNHAHLGFVVGDTLPVTVRLLAEINHNQLSTIEREVTLEGYPAAETLAALETLYIPDVAKDDFLTMVERERLLSQDIGAMVIAPLVANQRLTGVIVFIHPGPQPIPASRLRALRNLADQAAVVFENQTLLRSTAQSLAETRTLYEINRSILAAQDTLDILRALREHIAPNAMNINHMGFNYDDQNRIQGMVIDYMSNLNDEQVVQVSLDTLVGRDKIDELNTYWNTLRTPIGIVENIDRAPENYPLADFLKATNIGSFIAIPIRDGGLVRELVTLSFDHPQTFDDQQRRLYEGLTDQIAIVLQSHRLLRDTQLSAAQLSNQVRVLQLVNQLSSTISTVEDEQTLLDQSARVLTEAVGVEHCGIVLLNPQQTIGTVASEYPSLGTLGSQIDMSNNELFRLIQETRQPVIVNDLENDQRIIPATRELMQKLGIRAVAFLPLIVQDRIFGSIGLDITSFERTFSLEMVNIAQTITTQLAIGLQNARLLSDTQHRADQLQRITAFSQSVQATLDLTNIFNLMLAQSAEMLPQDHISIALYDTAQSQLRTVAQYADGVTSVTLSGIESVPIKGHIAKVWETWQLVHIEDARSAPEKIETKANLRALMVAPMVTRGRIMGIVSVGSARAFAYTETDVAVFQQIVNQLSVAIENAEAFRQSQRVAKNESLVNDISTQLQRQMDIHSMLDVTVNELGKVLGARRARIRLGTNAPSADDGNNE